MSLTSSFNPTPTPLIYIVDDDEAVRDSLQWLLEGAGHRVHCFESAEAFLENYRAEAPGCAFVDIRMDGMSGLQLQEQMHENNPAFPITIITGHGDVPLAVESMKKGAFDFVQKPFDEKALMSLVERMMEHAREEFPKQEADIARRALLNRLTARESQVLERIVAGRLNKQIADDLDISIKTVEAHRANIMDKLKVQNVADLLKIALGNDKIAN